MSVYCIGPGHGPEPVIVPDGTRHCAACVAWWERAEEEAIARRRAAKLNLGFGPPRSWWPDWTDEEYAGHVARCGWCPRCVTRQHCCLPSRRCWRPKCEGEPLLPCEPNWDG